ncbi:Dabb family protein [Ruminococcus sp.]|uniref:Dabb family protein n=1 Tax=Ruminococcus sp. TaxID=41978 RepID=UPI003529D125
MIRHISIFFIKEEMKSKLPELLEILKTCTENVNAASYMTGIDCMPRPAEKIAGLPEFGDMVQVIDFADRKEAEQYSAHPAHQKLMQEIGYAVDKVVAIDVEG